MAKASKSFSLRAALSVSAAVVAVALFCAGWWFTSLTHEERTEEKTAALSLSNRNYEQSVSWRRSAISASNSAAIETQKPQAEVNAEEPVVPSGRPVESDFGPNAYVAGRDFVQGILQAPSTAKFSKPFVDDSTGWSELGENKWSVYGFVDAQNALGAMLRQKWSATVTKNGNDFEVARCVVGGEQVFPKSEY
jgi:hypothetical protein